MVTVATVMLFIALVLFILAAIGVNAGPINLTAAGLAFWVGAQLFGPLIR